MLAYGAAIRNRAHAQEKLRRIQQQFTCLRLNICSFFEFLIIFVNRCRLALVERFLIAT